MAGHRCDKIMICFPNVRGKVGVIAFKCGGLGRGGPDWFGWVLEIWPNPIYGPLAGYLKAIWLDLFGWVLEIWPRLQSMVPLLGTLRQSVRTGLGVFLIEIWPLSVGGSSKNVGGRRPFHS
jgi:hypothetical protein